MKLGLDVFREPRQLRPEVGIWDMIGFGDALAQAASSYGDAYFEMNQVDYWTLNQERAQEVQYNAFIDFKRSQSILPTSLR